MAALVAWHGGCQWFVSLMVCFCKQSCVPLRDGQGWGSVARGLRLQGLPALFAVRGSWGNWVVPSSPLFWVLLRLICVKLTEFCYLLARESVCPSPNTSEICILIRAMARGGRAAEVGQQELCKLARGAGTSQPSPAKQQVGEAPCRQQKQLCRGGKEGVKPHS